MTTKDMQCTNEKYEQNSTAEYEKPAKDPLEKSTLVSKLLFRYQYN